MTAADILTVPDITPRFSALDCKEARVLDFVEQLNDAALRARACGEGYLAGIVDFEPEPRQGLSLELSFPGFILLDEQPVVELDCPAPPVRSVSRPQVSSIYDQLTYLEEMNARPADRRHDAVIMWAVVHRHEEAA